MDYKPPVLMRLCGNEEPSGNADIDMEWRTPVGWRHI